MPTFKRGRGRPPKEGQSGSQLAEERKHDRKVHGDRGRPYINKEDKTVAEHIAEEVTEPARGRGRPPKQEQATKTQQTTPLKQTECTVTLDKRKETPPSTQTEPNINLGTSNNTPPPKPVEHTMTLGASTSPPKRGRGRPPKVHSMNTEAVINIHKADIIKRGRGRPVKAKNEESQQTVQPHNEPQPGRSSEIESVKTVTSVTSKVDDGTGDESVCDVKAGTESSVRKSSRSVKRRFDVKSLLKTGSIDLDWVDDGKKARVHKDTSQTAKQPQPMSQRSQTAKQPMSQRSQTAKKPMSQRSQTAKQPMNERSQTEKQPMTERSQMEKQPMNERSQPEKQTMNERSQTEKLEEPRNPRSQTEKQEEPMYQRNQTEKHKELTNQRSQTEKQEQPMNESRQIEKQEHPMNQRNQTEKHEEPMNQRNRTEKQEGPMKESSQTEKHEESINKKSQAEKQEQPMNQADNQSILSDENIAENEATLSVIQQSNGDVVVVIDKIEVPKNVTEVGKKRKRYSVEKKYTKGIKRGKLFHTDVSEKSTELTACGSESHLGSKDEVLHITSKEKEIGSGEQTTNENIVIECESVKSNEDVTQHIIYIEDDDSENITKVDSEDVTEYDEDATESYITIEDADDAEDGASGCEELTFNVEFEQKFVCFLCGKADLPGDSPYEKRQLYRKHILQEHLSEKGTISCPQCYKQFGIIKPNSVASRVWHVFANCVNHIISHYFVDTSSIPALFTVLTCDECEFRTIYKKHYDKHMQDVKACKIYAAKKEREKSKIQSGDKTAIHCILCDDSKHLFPDISGLCVHMTTEHYTATDTHNAVKCPHCTKEYKVSVSEKMRGSRRVMLTLLEHLIRKHSFEMPQFAEDLMFQCNECKFWTLSQNSFSDHQTSHVYKLNLCVSTDDQNEVYECFMCTTDPPTFTTWPNFRDHFKVEHIRMEAGPDNQDKPVGDKHSMTCPRCPDGRKVGIVNTSIWGVVIVKGLEHMVREHGYKVPWYVAMYTCDKCPYWSFCRRAFKAHTIRHAKESIPVMCQEMEQALGSNDQLLQCALCPGSDDSYNCWVSLVEHHKNVHWQVSGSNLMWQCAKCDFSLIKGNHTSWNRVIQRCLNHMLVKHMEDPPSFVKVLKCEACNYMTLVSDSLGTHQRFKGHGPFQTKAPIKSEQCPTCNKVFEHRNLKRHLESCPGLGDQRPRFRCQYCSKEYNWSEGLRSHIRHFHLGQIKHKCDLCGAGFIRKSSLSTHILDVHKVNNSKRPLIYCELCNFTCLYQNMLDTHHTKCHTHKSQEIPTCEFCDRTFHDIGKWISFFDNRISISNSCLVN